MTMPQSVWSGTFTLLGVEMHCHVLDNGERIIEAESFEKFIEAMATSETKIDEAEAVKFFRWQRGIDQ